MLRKAALIVLLKLGLHMAFNFTTKCIDVYIKQFSKYFQIVLISNVIHAILTSVLHFIYIRIVLLSEFSYFLKVITFGLWLQTFLLLYKSNQYN